MPRVAGINVVAWLAGAIAIYFIGFIIYGLTLGSVWAQQNAMDHGLVTPEQASSLTMEQLETMTIPGALDTTLAMSLGFVISLVTSLGLCIAQGMMKPKSLAEALRNGFILWLGFAATTLSYNVVYGSFSRVTFGIDMLHLFLDYLAASAVIFLLDGKVLSGAQAAAKPA